ARITSAGGRVRPPMAEANLLPTDPVSLRAAAGKIGPTLRHGRMEATMDLNELQQTLVTCIDDQLHAGRDRGDRLQDCHDLLRILMGASLWLERCRLMIDLESCHEPTFEEHLLGVAQSIQSV